MEWFYTNSISFIEHTEGNETKYDSSGEPAISDDTNEFITYLQTKFVSEINLAETDQSILSFGKSKVCSKEQDLVENEDTIWNKSFRKAEHGDRRDVVYKTLLRSLRRHLWNLFKAQNSPLPKMRKNRACPQFYTLLQKFFKNLFSTEVLEKFTKNEEEQEYIMEMFAAIMTKSYITPDRSEEIKMYTHLLK